MADSKEEQLEEIREMIETLKEKGESYESLGAKAGVSSTTIFRIHKKEAAPKKKTLRKVLNAFQSMLPSKEDREEGITGFASPFTFREPQSKLEKKYGEMAEEIEKFMADDSIPTVYKQEFLRIVKNMIVSLKRLSEE